MKKNLMIRVSAIVMVLIAVFFSVLPDFVNAEGEGEIPPVETVAEVPGITDVVVPDFSEENLPSAGDAAADMPIIAAGEENPSDLLTEGSLPETNPADGNLTEIGTEAADLGENDTAVTEPAEGKPIVPETEEQDSAVIKPEGEDSVATKPEGEDSVVTKPEDEDSAITKPEDGDSTVTKPEEQDSEASNPIESDPIVENPKEDTSTVTKPAEGIEDAKQPAVELRPAKKKEKTEILKENITGVISKKQVVQFLENGTLFHAEQSKNEAAEPLDETGAAGDFVVNGTTVTGYNGSGGYITIPEGITAIGDNAFSGVGSIVGVMLPGSLNTIGNSAFNSCSNLEVVNIPASITSIGTSAFANCTGLTGLSIASSAPIGANAFSGCTSLSSVTIPEGVSSIGAGAFSNCVNLGSVELPSTMASLSMDAFSGDVNLASISVKSGSYSSYKGCVYTADGRHLLLCPPGKTGIDFSPEMLSISSGAFTGCAYLLSVVIPDVTQTIESGAFSGSSIKAVTIPAGVSSIGEQSGWVPNVIYGSPKSVAEMWAADNNYDFDSLSGNEEEPDTEAPGHIVDTEPGTETPSTEEPSSEDPGTNKPNNTGKKPGSTNNTPGSTNNTPGGAINTSGSNGGTSGPAGIVSSGVGQTKTYSAAPAAASGGSLAAISRNANSRVKDATPKTGVEDYSIYFLFIAAFLFGVASFAFSRKIYLERK